MKKQDILNIAKNISKERGEKRETVEKGIYKQKIKIKEKIIICLDTIINREKKLKNESLAIIHNNEIKFLYNYIIEIEEVYIKVNDIYIIKDLEWLEELMKIYNIISKDITKRKLSSNLNWLKKI
ncbi:hypothetical protein V6O07_10435, partial [Arthrospira platensis SPKY2]